MPRPNQPRSIGAEDNLRANVRRFLADQERSTSWLARRMGEFGCQVTGAQVWKTLNEGRKVTVEEGMAIADALGTPLTALISDSEEPRA